MNRFFFLWIFLISFNIQAQQRQMSTAEAEVVKRNVQEMALKTRTIESDFIQEKEMSVIAEKILSKGKFFFKKDKMLRWEYITPFPYLIIINQNQLLVRDENKDNRINLQTNKVFREINNIIMGAVQGTLLNDSKNFSSNIFETNGNYLCKLSPLNSKLKESLGEVWLYFNKTDFSVDKLEMRESTGDYTRIIFVRKKINLSVPDEKFDLK